MEPAACVKKRPNALVSPNPFDTEAIEPFITFDLRRFRFTGDLDVVARLDSRPNLLKLSPEFAGAARTSLDKASGNTASEHDDQRPGRIPES